MADRTKTQAEIKGTVQENNTRHLIVFAFLSAAIFLAYSNSLNGTWALDDASLGRVGNIGNDLTLRIGRRKITDLTFLLNQWINPFSVFNYRVTNIVLHVINSMLVYWISLVTLRLPEMRERFGKYSYPVALLTSTIFAVHPININAVAYIVQRLTSLSAFFVLLALLSYSYARTSAGRLMSVTLYLSSVVLVLMGIFSKENAVLALPLFMMYDYFFISGLRGKGFLRNGVIVTLGGLAVFAVTSIYYVNFFRTAGDLFRILLNMNQQIPPATWTAVDVYWTPLQHIMTEFRIIARYLVLLLLPLPNFLVFDRWGMPLSTGVTEPLTTLISFLIIAGLLLFSVLKAKKMPFLSFGILWYLIAISLESFAVGSDLYFEHRNYLPVAGLFLGITAQAAVLSKETLLKAKTLWTVVLVLSVLLGGLTFQRNFVWKDSITLWSDTVKKEPGDLRAIVALGNAYMKSADLASAGKYYEKALKLSYLNKRGIYFKDSAYSLGMVSLFMGNPGQAKKVIDLMDSRLEDSYTTGILKGFYSASTGDPEAAIRQFNEILPQTTDFDRVIVYTLLGDTYLRMENAVPAIENYKKAIEIDPSSSEAYYGMGDAYFRLKDIKNAEACISKSLALDPSNPLALALMADIILVEKGPVEKAKTYAEKAVAASPSFYQPYAAMGTVLVIMGREDAAEEYFQKAYARGLRGYLLPYAKARAYLIKGDKEKAEVFLREIADMEDAPAGLRNMIKREKGRR